MKGIIAGGRNFDDYDTLGRVCDQMLQNQSEIEIVSGAASGADNLGEQYAHERGHEVKSFPADWNKQGKAAGPCTLQDKFINPCPKFGIAYYEIIM